MIEITNMDIISTNPIGRPTSGSCASRTGISVAPAAVRIRVAKIERIEIATITTAR